jgi:type VI protein secretion system component Hcp
MQWRLCNARVSSYQLGGSAEKPMETVSFSYESFEIVYIKQSQTGALDEKYQQGWAVGKNIELAGMTLPYKGQGAK